MSEPAQFRIVPIQGATYRESLERVEAQWSGLWRAHRSPARLVSVVHPFSFAPLRKQLQEQASRLEPLLLADDPDGWPYPWSIDQRAMLDRVERDMPPLTVDHYAVFWPSSTTERETLAENIKAAFGLPAVEDHPLPLLLPTAYEPHLRHLQPTEPGQPLVRFLTAYKALGTWDPTSWMELLYGDIPLVLCIDIQTVRRDLAHSKVLGAKSRLYVAAYGKHAADDQESRDGYQAATEMQAMLRHDNLHMLTYVIMIQGRDVKELDRRETRIRTIMAGKLELEVLPGAQRSLARFFTPKATATIHVPVVPWNTPSTGMGSKLPWLVDKRAATRGVVWGIGETSLPMTRHLLSEAQHNISGCVLGKAGAGKTTSLLIELLRLAAAPEDPMQVVFVDPNGWGRLLAEAVGDERSGRYYAVAGDATINVLDRVHESSDEQALAVRRKLGLIMGTVEVGSSEVRAQPRAFDAFEWPALDLALQRVYACHETPLLHDLVAALQDVIDEHGITEAVGLQRALDLALKTSWAEKFDRPTTLHWDFGPQVLAYSFEHVPKERLPLYYTIVFEELDRYVRSRTVRWPLLACVDELGYMRQVPELMDYARRSTKTWRNKWAGFVGCDQDPATFLEDPNGRAIWDNAHWRLIFQLLPTAAAQLGKAMGDLLPEERIRSIVTAEAGECVALFGNEVHRLYVAPTGMEWQAFITPRERTAQPEIEEVTG